MQTKACTTEAGTNTSELFQRKHGKRVGVGHVCLYSEPIHSTAKYPITTKTQRSYITYLSISAFDLFSLKINTNFMKQKKKKKTSEDQVKF